MNDEFPKTIYALPKNSKHETYITASDDGLNLINNGDSQIVVGVYEFKRRAKISSRKICKITEIDD